MECQTVAAKKISMYTLSADVIYSLHINVYNFDNMFVVRINYQTSLHFMPFRRIYLVGLFIISVDIEVTSY